MIAAIESVEEPVPQAGGGAGVNRWPEVVHKSISVHWMVAL